MFKHCSLLEKCKSKLQWDITSGWSERPSSKSLQTINAGESVEKRECSCTVGGNVNWDSHYERQYGDSLKKLGIKPPYDPAIPLLGIIPSGKQNWKRHVFPIVYCSTIYKAKRGGEWWWRGKKTCASFAVAPQTTNIMAAVHTWCMDQIRPLRPWMYIRRFQS